MDYHFVLQLATLSALLLCCAPRGLGAKPRALFVFGDSYADTGNHNPYVPILNRPWKSPYGKTWPGEGTGRYSDGKVFTDYFAEYLGLPSAPITARMAKGKKEYEEGMNGINFAYGGSGMFSTFGPIIPRVNSQIQQFRDLLQSGFLSKDLIATSMILFVVCGNDYTAYGDNHPNDEGILDFVPDVASEIDGTLKAFYELGARKISVTKMLPYGCYPKVTSKINYSRCNASQNARTILHNKLLTNHVAEFKALHSDVEIVMLDFQQAFEMAFEGHYDEVDLLNVDSSFQRRINLRPCCDGTGEGSSCGETDFLGRKLYKVCENVEDFFFWDNVHPSHAGWEALSKVLFGPLPY
eukprot:c16075_g1_i1 orf=300-1358(+)